MREQHAVPESENDDGIFHNEVAIHGLRNGVILRMTCRWCMGEMEMAPTSDGTTMRDPNTGFDHPCTAGLICPQCDRPSRNPQELWGT